ncbi:uncharacterized protein LOC132842608 isoform X2 [Tachysurus vachellii]|uniref:uncharacterized protein LOC132842608 isoform X2 n=1 Tax=Tachysurus vachellii TaxID=175792 RepID=UPI00296AE883|nr:uncharacterized protein LOC132842608 isoform X2 [Tachysurus vachellii]
MASSNQDASQYLRDAHENLVKQLQNLPLIVRRLHQQNVLNTDEVSELKDEHEKRKYSRKILDLVLNKGEEACYEFLRILDRERNSVFPNPDSSSLTPDLHTWICLFSFTDEAEDVYIYGPTSCHKLQNLLKTSVKQQPEKSLQFYGGKVQHNFTFIPLVLDTDTEKNKPHNKIILKSKKCKKPRLKNMKSYIPKDTQRKSPEDLLNSSEKSILIVGKPGIGKTTVVQQMLHHWAERSDRNLDFMFYFDENTLSNISTTESLENLLLSKYLMLNPQLKENAEEILQYLQLYSDSVTIVFDGIRDFQENRFLLEIMEHELLPEAKIVTTCRPEVEYEFSDWTTCKVYVQGFSEESIYDFFRKMSVNEPELVDIVINNPALFSLCHVPMHAFMVAACISYYTSEEAQKHFTATELYVRIFRHCLQRQGKKEFLDLDGHIKHCRDMVLSLAESAFNATKLKTINLEFDYDERGISGAFLKTVSAVSRARISCAFLHNTMQEFFSALWLLEKSEILDEVLNLCQNEDSEHMKHIIPFLCGLQSQTIIDHLKCLFPLNKIKDNIDVFFEKVLNTFIGEQPDDENTDIAFICQCLYEFQSPETCCSFLERINYHLDLSEEHLDPYTCCAVSYVIRQSTNTQVHLDMENSAVSLSGLKIILQHSHYLRDFSTTLSQIWTIALKCEELNYLRNLLQLCRNEIHIPMSSQTDVLEQAGKFITRYAEQPNLHLHCDKDPQQLTDLFLSTVFSWLPHISSLNFTSTLGESKENCQQKCMPFKLDLCLQAFLYQREENIWKTVEKIMSNICKERSDFLLDLFSHVKQYESKTHRTVLPALLPVYQSLPVWSINLSERKVSDLLEVLKLQTQKIPVELRDCSDEESEVRSFLQCLPYISHLSFNDFYFTDGEKKKKWRKFLLDLCLQTALHQPQNIQETVKKVMTEIEEYEEEEDYYEEQSDFLLDLFSQLKQYESKTHRTVLPALLTVYQSLPVWSINLSERKVSDLLEVLKLQTQKIPVKLRDCSGEESEVRSLLQCLPYISHLSFNVFYFTDGEKKKKWRKFLLDLCLQTALHQPQNIQETVKKVMTDYYEEQSDFLLDLFSHVKQYESKTHRTVLPALLTVYQSLPVWSINLSERKVSDLLEVLKLQTQKIPVKLRDCSDEESEVRSFLQCLPYISHLSFNDLYSQRKKHTEFLMNLFHHTTESDRHTGGKSLELLASVCNHTSFPYGENSTVYNSDFLLDLFSHVKQYESKTHRTVLPVLLTVYQSLPVWSINLSERKVSVLLEVLKLQTQKIPVELRDCSDEESEVRSFLQCLPYISHLRFNESHFTDGEKKKRWRKFLLDLCLQTAQNQPQNIQETVKKVMTDYYEEQSEFLLDLFSHVKQYESKTHRTVLPALLPVYQSLPVWSINLSERKVSVLLEVLKLQTQKIPVELRDCSDEESEVRSFLRCLPYISHLSFNESHFTDGGKKKWRTFLLDLCLQTALHKPQNIQKTVEKVMPEIGEYVKDYYERSDFLLDLFSHVKQYESKTHRTVLPALLPVYQSLPVWSIKLSERKVSVLLEVLKLQKQKIPVELRDCSDEESEVMSFFQCLPYISDLRFNEFHFTDEEKKKRWRKFLLDLYLQTALHQPQNIQERVTTGYNEEQNDFLLDLFSHVKQYESKTHRTVLPALLTVYQSLPVWSINLSERKVSDLLEVLKLQTQKIPVELRDCSDEESEVRSFLQCLPYISHLSFKESHFTEEEKKKRWRKFLLDLCLQTALHQPQNIQETVKKVMTDYYEEQSDFLLDLFSHVKQYESKTHRTVLPALLTVYQSVPVWSIKLSERKVSDLLEVLKLQTQKIPVELRDCSDEESEVRSFLQCLPYISQLRFKQFYSASASIQFMVNLIIAAVDCLSDKGESFTELLVSVCSYNTFPFRQDFHAFHVKRSEFLLYLFSHVKQYESKTHRTVLPILLTVYQSLPAVRFKEFYFTDEEKKKRWRKFLMDLCLQTALHQPQNIQQTVKKVMTDYYEEQSDFLLDLFSHVKQYESKTHRTVLPALLTVYQSLPVWSIKLSERKVSDLLEVLKLQTQKIPVELRDCSDEESEVRSFLQCLPYISHLSFNEFYSASASIQFMVNLIIAAVDCLSDKGESFTELLVSVCSYNTFPFRQDFHAFHVKRSEFLLYLFSHVKQYESKTHRTVLPILLTVYQSLPAVRFKEFYFTDEEKKKRWRKFLMDLCLQTALHQPQNIQQTVKKVMTDYYEEQSDFLLDLFSHVKQYESKTHRTVLPALLTVYQSLPVWSIKLSERKVSDLLEVLKLQTQKIPVELRDCSDEESEVRSFLQCLPYISHLSFNEFYSASASIQFMVNLIIAAVDCQSDKGESFTELLVSVCSYNTFPFRQDFHAFHVKRSEFLLYLFSHVKQYESKTHRTVLPILLTVYQSLPAVRFKEFYFTDEEKKKRWRKFLMDLCLQTALHQPQNIQQTVKKVMTDYYEEQSDFLLDLFSHVKQYESKTHRTVLPALLTVYQSLPVWSIKLSERKVSDLLEVLKLQTQKKPVELRDCSDEESEVRSFLQCLPYISHLSFNEFYSASASIQFMVNLIIAAVDCQSDKGESFTELLVSVCSYNTFPFRQDFHGFHEVQSEFLLYLFSHVKQYESKTHRTVLPILLTVYQSLPAVRFNVFYFTDREKKKKWRKFLLDLCLQTAQHQPQNIQETVEKVMTGIEYYEEDEDYYEEQSDFLLDLFSHVKQYESKTHRTVLPVLLPVYQSLPVWSINLSERKVSVLLEVLKLQTQKKPVELRDCSDEESEVRSFLQCLPYISHLSFNEFYSASAYVQFMMNLIIAAVDCQSDKGESFTELLVSVCSYNTFPFRQEFHGFHEEQSEFLLDLFSHVKQYESKTHRTVLPVLLPVYQSLPVWSINLSERKVSVLLEVLKLQTQKKPVELRDCSGEESEVRSFLQCLPYISQLRCDSWLIPRLSKAVVDHAEDTELVRAFFAAMDFVLIIDWVLTTREYRAVRKLLNLSDSSLKLALKPQAISLRGARLLFRHITHLQKLCLSERVLVRMIRAVRAGGSFRSSESRWVIQELCLDFNIINPKIFRYLSSLSSLLNLWTVHCVNLTGCRMEAHSLLSLMCHPGLLKIRLSKSTLQQFTDLLYEAQDGELTRLFLEKVGGDLTSCSLSWEELIYLLQQRVCCISVNIRKNKITHKHTREILPLLSEIQFKRLNPSVLLSIIREIYETDSAHYVSSLLKSTQNCINLNNTDLDSCHCTALCFTLQHCTSVSLSLMWTSIPDGELVKILPLFNRLSQLSVDRFLLLKLLHCCSISELQQGAAAAVFSALQNRLDFSCSTGLDLSTETQDKTLHLSTEDCRDISTAIQKSQQRTELILEDCELEDTGVDVFLLILHTVTLRCSKSLLLRFLALLRLVNQSDCVMNAMSLSKALNGDMDLSKTPLDLGACRSLALFLEFSEGLSELDLSHCKLTDQGLELLLPHLHKVEVLDLSHNDIDDCLAGRIYTVVSISSNIQTVRLFNNRITDKETFQKDKRFEIW